MTYNNNLFPKDSKITRNDRMKLNCHNSFVLWFTGFSGSGKSTLADLLEEKLFNKNIRTYILDGDNIRSGMNADLGFSRKDREENIRRISEIAKLFVDAGLVVITVFISPYRSDRERARSMFDKGEFIEVYVRCPLTVCEDRDVKGLYKKVKEGKVKEFTGKTDPYEEPISPEIIIDTDRDDINLCVEKILNYLNGHNVLKIVD